MCKWDLKNCSFSNSFTKELFCVIDIMIALSTLGFLLSSLIVSNNNMRTVKIKS